MIYPLLMRLDTSAMPVNVEITRTGWRFQSDLDAANFQALPVAERLSLRADLAAQVELAENTPTKGDAP